MVQFGKVGIRPSGLTPPNTLVLSLDSSNASSYNGSGSMWYDLTAKGNNATFINTPTFSANNSGILQFDGGNYATINDDASLEFGNGAFSTEMWIKFSTLKGYQGILSKPGYSDGNGFVFLLESNNTFMMYAGNGGWQIGLGGQVTPNVDEWYHVVITRTSSGDWKMYINGQDQSGGVGANPSFNFPDETTPMYIGSYTNFPGYSNQPSNNFEGYLGFVKLWKGKSLSQNEVTTFFNNNTSRFANGGNNVTYGKITIDGTQYDTTVNNGAVYNQSSNTYTFDGNDDYAILANAPQPGNEMTVSAWVNADVLGGWRKAVIFPYGATSWDPPYFSYQIGAEGNNLTVGFGIDSDFNTGSIYTPNAETNTWYHVVGAFSNGIIKMYVNGELVGTKDVTAQRTSIIYTNRTDLVIGLDAEYFQAEQWQGQVSDVQVLTTELSSTDVLNHFNSTKVSYGFIPTGSMKINGVESTTSLMNGALYDSNTDVYSFNGSNYAEKSNFLGSTNTFTVSNWINLSYDQAGRTIFSNFAPGESGWVTGISDSTNNKVKFYLGGATLLSNTTLNANTWYHVVVTYDNGSPKIYINGTLDNSSNNTINFSNGSYYGNDIGRLGSGGQTFAGNVAKVDVHTYALSSTDIEQEFNDTKTQFGY